MHGVGQVGQVKFPLPPGDIWRVVVGVAYALGALGMGAVGAHHLHVPRAHRRAQSAIVKDQVRRFIAGITNVSVFPFQGISLLYVCIQFFWPCASSRYSLGVTPSYLRNRRMSVERE